MQKLIQLYQPSQHELDNKMEIYFSDGWKVKQMISDNGYLVLLLEKETRKEKLDELDLIAKQ